MGYDVGPCGAENKTLVMQVFDTDGHYIPTKPSPHKINELLKSKVPNSIINTLISSQIM